MQLNKQIRIKKEVFIMQVAYASLTKINIKHAKTFVLIGKQIKKLTVHNKR